MSISSSLLITKKKKKKNWRNQDCIHNQKSQKSFIPATKVNIVKLGDPNSTKKKNKNQTCLDKTEYNFSQIKYYNCQKLGPYASTC